MDVLCLSSMSESPRNQFFNCYNELNEFGSICDLNVTLHHDVGVSVIWFVFPRCLSSTSQVVATGGGPIGRWTPNRHMHLKGLQFQKTSRYKVIKESGSMVYCITLMYALEDASVDV